MILDLVPGWLQSPSAVVDTSMGTPALAKGVHVWGCAPAGSSSPEPGVNYPWYPLPPGADVLERALAVASGHCVSPWRGPGTLSHPA